MQRRQFHLETRGNHFEAWSYLARDEVTGRAYVLREWTYASSDQGRDRIEPADYLREGAGADDLLRLIGSLIPEEVR